MAHFLAPMASLLPEPSFAYPPNTNVVRCDSISDALFVNGVLGSGTYATVKKCVSKNKTMSEETEKAVKFISEETFLHTKKQLQNEVAILSKFPKHPRILSMNEIIRVPGKYFCIVTELVTGGDLFDYIVNSPNGKLPEPLARRILKQIIEGLDVLHTLNILHRDLKPENILIGKSGEDEVDIKLADFGLATFFSEDKPPVKNCGTTGYTAPEVLTKQPYGKACDIWSVGVILFAMLHGYLPFHGTQEEMKEKILACEYKFSKKTQISANAKALIKEMLNLDAARRPTVKTITENAWMKEQ